MNQKSNAWIITILFSAVILIFTAADFLKEDRLYSEAENRLLAGRPEFTVKSLLEGSYSEAYETYVTDQFVSRDKWIAIKTYWDIFLQKKEISGVYLGTGGYLIEQHLPEDYTEESIKKKLGLLKDLVERWDAKVILVPTADNILADKLPVNAPCFDQKVFLTQAEQTIGKEYFVDVWSALAEHAREDIYYRTDHHWTSLGAYYGYQAWAEAMGEKPYPYDEEALESVTEDFLGTLHSKVNIKWKPDAIHYFPETAEWPVTVTYDFKTVSHKLYEEKYLNTKNKYGFFLDDNHGFVEIDTGHHGGRTLFLIKDSYANCFVPFLLPHYDKIYILDLRYYHGRLFELMERYAPDVGLDMKPKNAESEDKELEVLVLYNCVHFLEDFVYD